MSILRAGNLKNYNFMTITQQNVFKEVSKVSHPAISYSLVKLGIITDVELTDKRAFVFFAFPFPNIPIANELINSVSNPLQNMGLEFEYSVRIMTEKERNRFLELEAEAWKS